MIEIFKDIYCKPFTSDGYGYIFDKNSNISAKIIGYNPELEKYLVAILNGENIPHTIHFKYEGTSNESMLMIDDKHSVDIRGWGQLMSSGMSANEAAKIQDECGKYIEELSNK